MTIGPGTRLGSFEILDPIGSGGMGQLYRAKDLKLGRLVALKVLRPELAAHPERLRRFEQEARSASALSHPNIVHIYDIDTEGDAAYIAMELVEGRTLREILVAGPVVLPRIRRLGMQIAEGLSCAHEAGIVHRDLKPENLMVDGEGRIRILDFGLAKLGAEGMIGGSDSRLTTLAAQGTRPGVLLGTVEYMSPEQAVARPVDFRSDQFSLGVILYEMATGQLPFQRESAPQTLAAIIEQEAPPLPAGLPTGLRSLIERLLRKAPEERYASTREVVSALEQLPTGARALPRPPTLPPLVSPSPRLPRSPMPSMPAALPRLFRVQIEGKVKELKLERLRRKIRRNSYSGLELVLPDGETDWRPLYETEIFRQEVPHGGNPRRTAQWRKVREFGGHLMGFMITGLIMTVLQGSPPFWLAFWAIGLFIHGTAVLPAAIDLLKEQGPARAPRQVEARAEAPVPRYASASFLEEVTRVRELVERQEGEDRSQLEEAIDAIVASVEDLGARMADLEAQTSHEIEQKLEQTEAEARGSFERAERPADRELFQRQLEVLGTRRDSIRQARRLLDKLAARKGMAEQQLMQLRLDLSRAEALRAGTPELSSRLEQIRLEVEAAEVVDDHLAGMRPEARWALEQALPEGPVDDTPERMPQRRDETEG